MSGKIAIRRGVFETNSSSTHSMQITPKENTDDEIFSELRKKMEEAMYSNYNYNKYTDIDNFIDKEQLNKFGDRVFVLEGFAELDSDFDITTNLSIKITSDLAKIQYLFSDFVNVIRNTKEYTDKSSKYTRWDYVSGTVLFKLKSYDIFCDVIKEYFSMHKDVFGEINGITLRENIPYMNYDSNKYSIFSEEDLNDKERIKGKIHYVLSCGNDIIYRNFDCHTAASVSIKVY